MEDNERIVQFLRKKDLLFRKELGRGACGQTVVLFDPVIGEEFVCKKYSPLHDEWREQLFKNFVREVKLLHLLNHRNVVRVFNYYLYPELLIGYILMEYVKGRDIEDYLKAHPENVNEVFAQAIEGFFHLEECRVLHRDIRPLNILVTNEGLLKIIDFGFGKQTTDSKDFEKSVTLNWWCQPPREFNAKVYDFATEVYFVGQLFQKILSDNSIEHFGYKDLLSHMSQFDPLNRIKSFADVRRRLLAGHIQDTHFSEEELQSYRDFADNLSSVVSKIERGSKYIDDVTDVEARLGQVYKKVMLERYVPDTNAIVRCFVSGGYYYAKNSRFEVDALRDFLNLLRSCSRERKNIVLSNIQSRLDAKDRYEQRTKFDDDIPF